ncbi:MAG: hypothetical protein Q9220_006455 [cf. Caloplaca sp. 1 TL-2023]
MAAEAPDPKTLGSWEDAFQYPVAAVRGMEKQLRNDINSNREKLRSLVGASYRDLLGTAESIIEMNGQMQEVESYLGQMGMRCNSRLLEKKATNLRVWSDATKAQGTLNSCLQSEGDWLLTGVSADRERYALASQLAVLRGCPDAISRLLKTGGSTLLAAKVLVISRLLHKKLSQRPEPFPYLEVLRDRLAALRRRFLAKIDRRLRSLGASEPALVEAMCAFSLATSSPPTDVLSHFHHVRQIAISKAAQIVNDDDGIFTSLRLLVKTLKDCQAVFPGQLARALEQLKASPLLQGADLRSLQELNLDIHQRWLGADINHFTPYVRPDELQKVEVMEVLKKWARNAFSSFLRDLTRKVEDIEDPAIIVYLRQAMIELWLSNQRLSMGVRPSEILEGIRDAFNDRLATLIHVQAGKLSAVASTIEKLLADWKPGISDACPSMWDETITTMDTASGGKALREALSVRAHGRGQPVDIVSATYRIWLNHIHDLEDMIKTLRDKKWVDEVDDMEDEDDMLENKQTLLSGDDPRFLNDTLKDDLESGFLKLYGSLHRQAQYLRASDDYNDDGVTAAHQSAFLLRVWRDITNNLPPTYTARIDTETDDLLPLLYHRISAAVCLRPLLRCDKRIATSQRHLRLESRVLWEGEATHLPVLPSPWSFRLLYDVIKLMTVYGTNIWTLQATRVLKKRLREGLAPLTAKLPEEQSAMNGHDVDPRSPVRLLESGQNDADGDGDVKDEEMEADENGHEVDHQQHANGVLSTTKTATRGPAKEVVRDMKIQRFFDILYLQHATSSAKGATHDALDEVEAAIGRDLQLADEHLDRMRRDAEAYWKRTGLLFALLTP